MIMDYKSCGCPDISYHGEEAWKPSWEHYSRQIGFMLCGDYAKGCEGSFWNVAMNMHWEAHRFVLPDLKNEMKWEKYFSTEAPEISQMEDSINREAYSEAEHQTCFDKKEILKGTKFSFVPFLYNQNRPKRSKSRERRCKNGYIRVFRQQNPRLLSNHV